MKKKEAQISTGIEAEGHLAKGEVKGSYGILGGEGNISVGNVGAEGSVGLSLFKDGKLYPSVGIDGKASVSGASGELKGQIGTDDYNAHVKASGDLLKAEAKGSAGAGFVQFEKEDGTGVSGLGVEGSVAAEAYLATGKLSGGIEIMGIKIDGAIKGHAGGAGVKAGGALTTNGVSGELGAGLGVGGGVKITVDWSDFHLPSWLSWN